MRPAVLLVAALACAASTGSPVECPSPPQPRVAVALGDSITYGWDANAQLLAVPYPARLNELLGASWAVMNAGVPGEMTSGARGRWRPGIRSTRPHALVVLSGINDVLSDVPAGTITANLQAVYDEALADGHQLVPVTVLPFGTSWGWTLARQAVVDEVNAWIRVYCTSRGIPCADASAAMDNGAGALAPAYASTDRLHLSQAGADKLATVVFGVMR